jgi:hypothetical protein
VRAASAEALVDTKGAPVYSKAGQAGSNCAGFRIAQEAVVEKIEVEVIEEIPTAEG